MEKSCGCIIFNNDKVLIVKQTSGFYGFPKGHIEIGETFEECAIRETREEVGLDVKVDSNYKFCISYLVHDKVPKEVVYFISFVVGNDSIKIQEDEIAEAMWVSCDKVSDILSFDNLREIWLQAYDKYKEVYNG